MASPSSHTEKVRRRKRVRQGIKRKRALKRLGSTPKLSVLLKDEPEPDTP